MLFKIQEEEIKEIKQEETKQEMPDGITVIDLEALVSGGLNEIQNEFDCKEYDYFLCVRKDGLIHEPFTSTQN